MFDWGALKRGVPKSVRFCIDDLPMYTFLIPTHPYIKYIATKVISYLTVSKKLKTSLTLYLLLITANVIAIKLPTA